MRFIGQNNGQTNSFLIYLAKCVPKRLPAILDLKTLLAVMLPRPNERRHGDTQTEVHFIIRSHMCGEQVLCIVPGSQKSGRYLRCQTHQSLLQGQLSQQRSNKKYQVYLNVFML